MNYYQENIQSTFSELCFNAVLKLLLKIETNKLGDRKKRFLFISFFSFLYITVTFLFIDF